MKSKSKKFLEGLKKGGEYVAKGYGKTIKFTKEYAPKAEARLSRVAKMSVESFKPTKFETRPMRDDFVQLPLSRPMRRQKNHDFGSLTFDI